MNASNHDQMLLTLQIVHKYLFRAGAADQDHKDNAIYKFVGSTLNIVETNKENLDD